MTRTKNKPLIFLFQEYTVSELAERTAYTERYLLAIKERRHPLTAKFKEKVAKFLHRPEAELFPEDSANPQS